MIDDLEKSRKHAVIALFLSLVCLGMLIAYLTVGNVLAAFGSLIALAVFVVLANRLAKGNG